jgi:phage I-like protein
MRRDLRELDDKFKMLVNMQMENVANFARNEERFARNEERFARNEERFARNEERLANLSAITDQRFAQMALVHAQTDRTLADLIDIVRQQKE